MKLKDLANLDIKDLQNIDYAALLSEFKKHPDVIIGILIIIFTIGSCIFFYTTKKNEFAELSRQLTVLEEKDNIYDDLLTAQSTLKSLKSVLPEKISEALFIEIIAETAKAQNITIDSFSPAVEHIQPAYSTLTLALNINAPSYADLWRFIHKMESENKTIRIDKWKVSLIQGGRQRGRFQKKQNFDTNRLSSSITLTVVNFTNE